MSEQSREITRESEVDHYVDTERIMKISTSWSSLFSFQCRSEIIFIAYVVVVVYYYVR